MQGYKNIGMQFYARTQGCKSTSMQRSMEVRMHGCKDTKMQKCSFMQGCKDKCMQRCQEVRMPKMKDKSVPDPGKGVCEDPVNGGAILEKGGQEPQGGNKKRQLSPDKGRVKT